MQIYGQKLLLGSFVRKFLAIMMGIYGQTPHFIDVSVNAEKLWKNKLCLLSDELGAEH